MIEPLLSNVNLISDNIIFIHGDKSTADDTNIAQLCNTQIFNITELLELSIPGYNEKCSLNEMATITTERQKMSLDTTEIYHNTKKRQTKKHSLDIRKRFFSPTLITV